MKSKLVELITTISGAKIAEHLNPFGKDGWLLDDCLPINRTRQTMGGPVFPRVDKHAFGSESDGRRYEYAVETVKAKDRGRDKTLSEKANELIAQREDAEWQFCKVLTTVVKGVVERMHLVFAKEL